VAVWRSVERNSPFRGVTLAGNSSSFGVRICFRITTEGAKGPIGERTCIKPLLKLRTITVDSAGLIAELKCTTPVLGWGIIGGVLGAVRKK